MKTTRNGLLLGTLILACASAAAQTPTRVRGTVTAVDGKVFAVK
jgi:hypothetical protein